MARSYKKNPWCKDGNRRKKRDKQIANRKIRRGGWSGKEIPSGGKYRQLSCSYDICDHRWEPLLSTSGTGSGGTLSGSLSMASKMRTALSLLIGARLTETGQGTACGSEGCECFG